MSWDPEFVCDLRTFLGDEAVTPEMGIRFCTNLARYEVLRDVLDGTVPPGVGSFAELHDHIDANGYGGAFRWPGPLQSDQTEDYCRYFCRFWNAVQDGVDVWVRAGRLPACLGALHPYQGEFGREWWLPRSLQQVLAATGWEDTSWHNDACPNWTSPDGNRRLWCDTKNPNLREGGPFGAPRYVVQNLHGDDADPGAWVFKTEHTGHMIWWLLREGD